MLEHDRTRALSVSDERETRTVAVLRQRAGLIGDDALAEVLRGDAIGLNLILATSIARRYINRGVDLDDLQQVALIGLVLAVDRFDHRHGTPFSPWARMTINGELKRHLRDHAWAVRPPRDLHDRYLEITSTINDLTHRLSRAPSTAEIADSLGVTSAKVHEARDVGGSYAATSLNMLIDQQADSFTGDGLNLGSVDTVDGRLTTLDLEQVLRALSPRDQTLVQLRFGQELTQRQIGLHLGISQMQVSRLLAAVVARLRLMLVSCSIREAA